MGTDYNGYQLAAKLRHRFSTDLSTDSSPVLGIVETGLITGREITFWHRAGQNRVVRTYTLVDASGCGPAIRQDIPSAFYQSLNHAGRIVIGVARCVFGSQKPGPRRAGLAEGEPPLNTPGRGKKPSGGQCMARPKKAPEEKREDRLYPRLTTAERVEIEDNAAILGVTP